jgi:hypothetical protein
MAMTKRTMRPMAVGTRIKIVEGSGLDSGKTGVIQMPRLDWRGMPKDVHGAYKPFDPTKEFYIRLDNGTFTTMFKVRVFPVPS